MNEDVYTDHAAEPVPNAKRIALINGLIWGFINIVLLLLAYYAMPQLLGNYAYGVVLLLVGLGLGVYFTLDIRSKIGGFWSFRYALSHIFILFFVQYLLFSLFTTAFPKWIEPDYANLVREIRLNSVTEVAERFGGGNQEQIDLMIEEAEKAIEKELNPTLADFLQTLAISVIMYFIGALIFAAIFKREKPVFAPITE